MLNEFERQQALKDLKLPRVKSMTRMERVEDAITDVLEKLDLPHAHSVTFWLQDAHNYMQIKEMEKLGAWLRKAALHYYDLIGIDPPPVTSKYLDEEQ